MPTMTQVRQASRLTTELYSARGRRWYAGRVRGDRYARTRLAEGRRDRYAVYEQLRAQGPVVRSRMFAWVTTSHPLCSEVLRSRTYGVRDPDAGVIAGGVADEMDLSLLGMDPPDHTRLRRLAAPAFSPRALRGFEERITATVDGLLDRAEAKAEREGGFDLVADLAAPLPITVISDLLGVPDADQEAFQRYGTILASALDGLDSLRHARSLFQANQEIEAIFTSLFEQREREPRDDLVSALVAERGDRVRPEELVPLCSLLLVAGFETTVNLIGNAVLALTDHRQQWDRLVADPSLASATVEETLRYLPPVQDTGRVCLADTELGGRPIRRGEWVVTLLAAAGRDPAVYDDPQRFDIARTPAVEHLAFSAGPHYCIGAPLARVESTVALRALAERLPRLRRAGRVTHRSSLTIRGPLRLPVAVGRHGVRAGWADAVG